MNHCSFIGNLAADPESKSLKNGDDVVSFRIGCSERWTDKASGEKKERTEWVNCTAFSPVAKVISQYTSKGSKVFVAGKMQTRKWQDKEGNDRYTTEIIVNTVELLTPKGSASREAQEDDEDERPAKTNGKTAPPPATKKAPVRNIDDEIPF